MARAVARDIDISFKQAIEITRSIRFKDVESAKTYLQRVIEKKEPQRFTRFTNGLGHKPGMAAGRYPIRACTAILALVKEAEANAQTRGLGTCKIIHAAAQKANKPFHYGRRTRRRMKRAHVEIVLQEKTQDRKTEAVDKPAKAKKQAKATSKEGTDQ
ncbi:MAG: 50S ribosomal protein L22 [Nanoarchaeota archaeon]